jgi:hypothetical protein
MIGVVVLEQFVEPVPQVRVSYPRLALAGLHLRAGRCLFDHGLLDCR